MRIGLVGCGRIGAMHAEVLKSLPEVKELVVVDAEPGRAALLAKQLEVAAASSFEDVLAMGPDGVVIAAATEAHGALLRESVAAGIPAFCEKPVALDIPQTVEVVETVAGYGVPVQVGFQRRFDPAYRAAREAFRSGRLGWLHSIRSVTSDATPPPESFIAHAGGLFRDCLVHDFDSIRWLTGREITTVFARGSNAGAPFFAKYGDVDSAACLLTLDDGTLCTVTGTRYNGAGHDVRLELLGEKDSVAVGLDDHTALASLEEGVDFPGGPRHATFADRFAAAYRAELEAFLALLCDGGTSQCTPEDALEATYVAEAAELSRRENRPVDVAEVRR
jgi:myo-inositol 2-dehydrogenase/D-chiro-inositol 1-dehydrogenase